MVSTRREYDQIAAVYLPIAVGVFVLVTALVLFMALRYRRRGDERRPPAPTDAPRLESLYVLVLACVAAFLVAFTFVHENSTDAVTHAPRGAGPTVNVVAAKWHWSFFYPRAGIRVYGSDAQAPTLYVPANTPVAFTLTSQDVIHSFAIPITDFKRGAYPAVSDRFSLVFDRPGYFRGGGECVEYCGLGHSEMRFDLRVLSPAAFAAWTRRASATRAAAG